MKIKNKNVFIHSLGCRVNLCEINSILNELVDCGANLVINQDYADIVILNTCSVTAKADQKSKYFVNKFLKLKKHPIVVVMGCFSQGNKTYFKHLNNERLIVIGNIYKNKIKSFLEKYQNKKIICIKDITKEKSFEQLYSLGFLENTRAFIKIQDGCNFMCSYCLIPYLRGRQRSLEHKKIINQIKSLIKGGYQEIVLTGVNLAGYQDKKISFFDLLKKIANIKGKFRIRLSSLEPFQINKEMIDFLTENNHIFCQHFHICLQSASDVVLKKMNRKYKYNEYLELINYIRLKNPLASITTDYIVGFDYESDKEFYISYERFKEISFAWAHLFPYSIRQKTISSFNKNEIVSENEKQRRMEKMIMLNEKNMNKYQKQFIGKTVHVLFEKANDPNIQSGHSEYFFKVFVKTKKNLTNKLLKVKITNLQKNHLFGIIA